MSCIHIFTAIWFTSMSLSPVRNPKLMTLSSTHHHFCSAQQKALLHPVSWVQPLPCHTTHLVGNSPKHTQVLCPLKIQQQKRVRRWDLGQLCGEGQWLTGISWKASHSILVWARHTVLLTLPHPLLVFLYAILVLYPYLKGDHHRTPQLCSIATALQ